MTEAVASTHIAVDVQAQGAVARSDFFQAMAQLQNAIAGAAKQNVSAARRMGAGAQDPLQQLSAVRLGGRRSAHVMSMDHANFAPSKIDMLEGAAWLGINRLVPGAVPSELLDARLDGNLVAFNQLQKQAQFLGIKQVGKVPLQDFANKALDDRQTAKDCNALAKNGVSHLYVPRDRLAARGPGKETAALREVIRENAAEMRAGRPAPNIEKPIEVKVEKPEATRVEVKTTREAKVEVAKQAAEEKKDQAEVRQAVTIEMTKPGQGIAALANRRRAGLGAEILNAELQNAKPQPAPTVSQNIINQINTTATQNNIIEQINGTEPLDENGQSEWEKKNGIPPTPHRRRRAVVPVMTPSYPSQ